MNAKTCKRLRRQARHMTIGHPAVRYLRTRDGSVMVDPISTKGAYRHLKRIASAPRA